MIRERVAIGTEIGLLGIIGWSFAAGICRMALELPLGVSLYVDAYR